MDASENEGSDILLQFSFWNLADEINSKLEILFSIVGVLALFLELCNHFWTIWKEYIQREDKFDHPFYSPYLRLIWPLMFKRIYNIFSI